MNELISLFGDTRDPGLPLLASYNPWLVLLSLAIAVFTSSMALQMAGVARASASLLYRQVAIGTGALALGGGVWSMHFIGMLALQLCTEVSYEPGITVLSVAPSLGASWVALQLLSRPRLSASALWVGGLLVGAGIGAMHYAGMAAMRMGPLLRFDPIWFALSIVVAVGLAVLALWIRFRLVRVRNLSSFQAVLISGSVMGLAISGMHYTGMIGARFVGSPTLDVAQSALHANYIALAVTLIALTLSVFVLAANSLLRYRLMYLQMQSSESKMRTLLDTGVDGIVTLDQRGHIVSANRLVERLFGWSTEELIGRHFEMLMPEAVRREYAGYLHAYAHGEPVDVVGQSRETLGLRRDGSLLPIRLALGMAVLPDQVLFVGFVSDISERKAMEQSLRDSEQQYRSLIRNIPGVSFRVLLDEYWTALFVSDAVEGLTGWPAEAFMAQEVRIGELIHPDDMKAFDDEVRASIAAGQSYVIEYRLIDREGHEHWIWEGGSAVLNDQGQPQWVDGVMLDITESKLRNAEYEGTVEAISRVMGMIEFDLEGRVLTANANLLALSGYTLEEIQGRHHSLFCYPDYVASDQYQDFWRRLRAGEYDAGEYHRRGKNGRSIWIQASYNPIFDSDGKPFKIVKFATDVSARHEIQNQLRLAKERAEQAAAAKTSFLANMSHEIRTPMNAVIGFSELLLGTSLDPTQRRHLETVRHSARSLLGLLNDILDTAKLEKGALELESVSFSLRDLCEQLVASLSLSAEAKGLSLTLDYSAELGDWFSGDPLRVQQILTNLLGNAVKFTEAGGVRLAVFEDQGRVHLRIEDSGIGIAADRLQKIFDPFAQADASMSRRFGGTGLGTTIARQLCELMGGEITVESELGVGSVFHVLLPLEAVDAGPLALAPLRQELPPLDILLADDMPQNLELLSMILGEQGHRIVQARDGAEAVAAFESGRFDILLLDVQMPGMDGLEATRRIRAIEAQHGMPRTPIIAITASVLEKDRRSAHEAGMDGFTSKPIDVAALFAELGRVFGLRAAASVPSVSEPAHGGVIDWDRGMRLWGSKQAVRDAITHFLEQNQEACARLGAALRAGDRKTAVAQAHRLRGVAGNLALVDLCERAATLEQALKNPAMSAFDDLQAQLASAFAAVTDRLALHAPRSAPRFADAADMPFDAAALRAVLPDFIDSLEHGELNEPLWASVRSALGEATAGAELAALEQLLDDFEFEEAAKRLQALQDRLNEMEVA